MIFLNSSFSSFFFFVKYIRMVINTQRRNLRKNIKTKKSYRNKKRNKSKKRVRRGGTENVKQSNVVNSTPVDIEGYIKKITLAMAELEGSLKESELIIEALNEKVSNLRALNKSLNLENERLKEDKNKLTDKVINEILQIPVANQNQSEIQAGNGSNYHE
jgi:hypothetical protein